MFLSFSFAGNACKGCFLDYHFVAQLCQNEGRALIGERKTCHFAVLTFVISSDLSDSDRDYNKASARSSVTNWTDVDSPLPFPFFPKLFILSFFRSIGLS